MAAFSDYVEKQGMALGELPMVHTTECFRLAGIQASNTLQAGFCDIFNESLLYFFYGRPAYRDASKTTPVRDVSFYPICFVFRPGTISKRVKRVYPFDTGALRRGLYEPAINPKVTLLDYQLPAAVESARKLVGGFFDTDERYLSSKPRPGMAFSPAEAEAESYYKLITGGGDSECDDRSSAVEIQISGCVDLSHDIMAIVLPTCFLEDANLAKTLLNVWRAQPLTYDADMGMRPIEFHGVVKLKVREFYRRSGLL